MFDEYYYTKSFSTCCNTNSELISSKVFYDDVGRVFSTTTNKSQTSTGYYFGNLKRLTEGTKYTYIFEAKASDNVDLLVGSEEGGHSEMKVNITWKRYSHTFTASPDRDYRTFVFYNWMGEENTTLDIRNLQIQEGELSTSDVVKKNNTKFGELLYLKRDNYQFLGWYTDSINGDKIDENSIVPKDNTTYYAHWKYIGEN